MTRLWPRPPSARATNLTLLLALLVTFATGVGAVATGSERGQWVVIAHGIGGLAIILLVPWKTRVVRGGLRRHRIGRWASLLLATLAVLTLLLGLGYATGVVREVAGVAGMWLHIAVALALVPLALWHIIVRRVRPRRTDVSRRALLRTGVVGAAAAGLYVASAAIVTLTGLPGARRRFTGSYEVAAADMPNTIWLDDTTQHIDPALWRLTVIDADGRREHTLSELRDIRTTWRATLDCTSGWYADEDWSGVPMSRLLSNVGDGRSVLVHSTTGYWVRFGVDELDHLLLATHAGGAPLTPGHGFPLRLVAPNRRGFWWVKWVDRIEVQAAPAWWQPPFPVT